MRRAACTVVVALLMLPALVTGARQQPGGIDAAPLRVIRGRVVSADPSAAPLRNVRILLTGATIAATPAYSDGQGRFEIAVPHAAPHRLSFSKAGFAPLDVERSASDAAGDLRITLERGAAIAGRVEDQFGDPLVTRVLARRVADEAGRRVAPAEWSAEADDLGAFRAGSLPPGRYEVTVDYTNPMLPPAERAERSLRPPTIVTVGPGEEIQLQFVEDVPPIDPRGRAIGGSRTPVVENGGIIRGTVIAGSRPVGGAFVLLFAGVEGARQTDADLDGVFEFAGLPAGTYRIMAGKISASMAMVDPNREVTVREGQVVDDVALVLRKPSAVTGTITDEYGDPIEGVTVELLQGWRGGGRTLVDRPPDVRPRRTDDRGQYRLFPVAPGDHYVAAGEEPRVVRGAADGPESSLRIYYPGTPALPEARPVHVAAGQDTRGVDIPYMRTTGARVFGHALDQAGQPLALPVTLIESVRSGAPLIARRQALVREDGAFAFLNVPPGEYVIQGLVRPAPGRPIEVGVMPVTVAGPDVQPVMLRTSRGTTLRGRVMLEGDTSGVQFDSFGVGAMSSDRDYDVIGIDAPGAGVSANGTFEMQVHGPMRITARAAPRGWWLKNATIGAVNAADEPYGPPGRSDRVVDVLVVFADSAGTISGRVLDARGRPVPGARVLLFPEDDSRWYVGSRYVRHMPSRTDGGYAVEAVPPGNHWIIAVDRLEGGEWQEPDVLRALAARALRLTLGEHQTVIADLSLVERDRP